MKTIERTPRPFLHIASEGNSESLVLGVKNIIIQSINHPTPLLNHGFQPSERIKTSVIQINELEGWL